MFNRLVTIRIKAAEEAFAAGRLEEALEIASAPDLAGQRAIRNLLKNVAEALLNRGQDHLMSRRFQDAVADIEKAGKCGLLNERAAEWHRRALQAMLDDRRAQGEKAEAIAAAKGRLAAGSIIGATDALARSPIQDADGAAIAAEIARQTERAKHALEEARSAVRAGHIVEAVERFRVAKTNHAKLDGIAEMEARLVEEVIGTALADYQNGRLLRAKQNMDVLGDVGQSRPQRVELAEALRLAEEAARAIREDRFSRAGVLLGRLTQITPRADWVNDACKQLETLEDQRRTLLTGPLGLLLGREGPGVDATFTGEGIVPEKRPATRRTPLAEQRPPATEHANERLPRRLLARIDGVGSFLILRGERISIGRAGPSATADISLMSDLSERHAEIVRSGEDYFVMSSSGVELAGRPVDHALLQDGDRLRLGRHIRLKFLKPSRKSPAAVLELGDGVRMTTDCRRAILWSGPLLMGNTKECHVHLAGGESLVLIDRGDRIAVKPVGPGGEERVVTLGSQTEIGEVRFSISEWPVVSG